MQLFRKNKRLDNFFQSSFPISRDLEVRVQSKDFALKTARCQGKMEHKKSSVKKSVKIKKIEEIKQKIRTKKIFFSKIFFEIFFFKMKNNDDRKHNKTKY